jgi:DNA-binding NarL/FixJ family response regulator
MKLTIYLIEDDIDFAKLLLQLLSSTPLFEVVGHATTLAVAREFLACETADVFLVDISLPDGNGIELMREIRMAYAHAKIMVLSTLGHEKYILSSLQAGASGYLLKSEMPSQIIQSIVSVANDGGALGQHASKILIEKIAQPSSFVAPPKSRVLITSAELEMLQAPISDQSTENANLTPRELEVLKVVQNGIVTKRVADILNISAFTVNQHLRNIYSKLGVRNKMEAVKAARHLGVL